MPSDSEPEEKKKKKYPKSLWVTNENRLWSEAITPEKNGTCLLPTQNEDTEWTEVKGKKKESKEKESKDSTKKKLRKKKNDTLIENRFERLDISPSQESSDESVNKKKRRRESKEDDDNTFHEKHGYNKWDNNTETDLDIDLTSTDEPYLSPDEEKKNIL